MDNNYAAIEQLDISIDELRQEAQSRETSEAVMLAIYAIADNSRSVEDIWGSPTPAEVDRVKMAVNEYEGSGTYYWGEETIEVGSVDYGSIMATYAIHAYTSLSAVSSEWTYCPDAGVFLEREPVERYDSLDDAVAVLEEITAIGNRSNLATEFSGHDEMFFRIENDDDRPAFFSECLVDLTYAP